MIKQASFITSAADKNGWINDDISEICFVGRSNVGKSSLINALTNQKSLANTSSVPGKTRLLNFFSINNNKWRIVDAPGYGYAKISLSQKEKFANLMEDYLTLRKNLKFVCQLIDLRHKPSNDDIDMYNFLKYHNIQVWIIATKLDKIKKNDMKKNIGIIKLTLNLIDSDSFFVVSVSKNNKQSIQTLSEKLDNSL
ncbi:ribosome biogenesis GTP-binding protein YihA/YsxC [Spiroplasma endosymbiont of Labia minor]|uniref:ribosome biogenesis GTP-binding protein YihA/YsxC n=1 Tax=Spiroplasma endosymbiont of Labia minor TaxID=3066305 RepID=UPI0030D3CDC4